MLTAKESKLSEEQKVRDTFLHEVLANHFRSVVEEMSTIVLRSAHTTFIKETQDYAATLATVEGEMFAYPHDTGVTSLLGMPLSAGVTAFEQWLPGDIMLTNDPFSTQGMVMHLPDLTLLKPIFAEGKLLCFAWAFMHCSDVGGAVPGSTDMASTEIFQEGTRIRPFKLYNAGVYNKEFWNIIADNCRIPELNKGDVGALVAGLQTAERRMQRLVAKYGFDNVHAGIYASLDQTEAKTRAILSQIPAGRYSFTDFMEDDVLTSAPIRIALTLESDGEGTVQLDYTGCDPQVRAALNLPTGDQLHHPFLCLSLINFVVSESEGMHLNAGILRCIDLLLPKHSVVNASFPAACGMRYLTAMRASDAILGALAQAVPEKVPAPGAGGVSITVFSMTDIANRSVKLAVANPIYGGSGGGPKLDGFTGLDYPLAFFRNVPAEILEGEVPVLVHGFGAIPDSEGAGRYRGGFGVWYEIETLHPNTTIVMRGKERYRFQPWGVHGGRAAAPAHCHVTMPTGKRDLGKASLYRLRLGEKLFIAGAGGGGYGDPTMRPVHEVARDVRNGLISEERARDVYGVIFSGSEPNLEASRKYREELRVQHSGSDLERIDRGFGYADWRARYGHASDIISAWLAELPGPLRPYGRDLAYERLLSMPHNPDPGAVRSVCEEIGYAIDGKRVSQSR